MDVRETAVILRRSFQESGQIEGNYPFEMTLEALCEWHIADPGGGWMEPVERVWRERNWKEGERFAWRKKPFASHEDAFARATGDDRTARSFVEETRRMLAEETRDEEGLVAHRHPRIPPDRKPLLVDAMQEFASRLSSAAALGGDSSWHDVAVHQFLGYRRILRNPDNGLWHLGRDWGEQPGTLSRGAWSRGHGWLLRGIVETLRWLPENHPGRVEMKSLLVETLEALIPLQDQDGMWHVLLHRPWSDSQAETSGTSLIAYAIARAIQMGLLQDSRWQDIAANAVRGICARVDAGGVVHGACRGPGLLFDEGESLYLHQPIPPGDHHGPPCALYGCLAGFLLLSRNQ